MNRETAEGEAFYDTVLAEAADVLDVFGMHYGNAEWIADAVAAMPLLRRGGAIWNTEAYGAPRRQISWWLWQRAAGVQRIFPFIYHTVLDDSEFDDFKRFGSYPVNRDYTPRPDAIALRTMSDLVGSAQPVGGGPVGLGYDAYTFASGGGPVVALTNRNDFGETWSPDAAVRLLLTMPRSIHRLTVVDLMGNRSTVRVRKGRLKLRLLGVAAFLVPEPGDSLTSLQVVRSKRSPRPRPRRAPRPGLQPGGFSCLSIDRYGTEEDRTRRRRHDRRHARAPLRAEGPRRRRPARRRRGAAAGQGARPRRRRVPSRAATSR